MATGIALLAIYSIEAPVVRASSIDAEQDPPRPVAEDAALFEKGRLHAQQKALRRLAVQTDPEADKVLSAQVEHYRADQLPPALWLELFEAIAKRNNPKLKARLAEARRDIEKSPDLLARFRECLQGGDADAGRVIFTKKPEAGCIRCHSVDGEGGQIGPELTWLRHSVERIHILESILLPNATIAQGFDNALLKLQSGEEIAGVVSFEEDDEITVTSVVDGKKRKVPVADIVERTPLPSPMPPFFSTVLGKREIRDLVEFLAEGD